MRTVSIAVTSGILLHGETGTPESPTSRAERAKCDSRKKEENSLNEKLLREQRGLL